MENPSTIVVSIVGVANVIAIGSLIFQAGGLVSKVKTLASDVEKLIESFSELDKKVARLEVLIGRHHEP
jgi:hypothetical protein